MTVHRVSTRPRRHPCGAVWFNGAHTPTLTVHKPEHGGADAPFLPPSVAQIRRQQLYPARHDTGRADEHPIDCDRCGYQAITEYIDNRAVLQQMQQGVESLFVLYRRRLRMSDLVRQRHLEICVSSQ
jgi:hypothetical protein